MLGFAGVDFQIERIDSAGDDANQRLAGTGVRARDRGDAERSAFGFEQRGAHRRFLRHGQISFAGAMFRSFLRLGDHRLCTPAMHFRLARRAHGMG
jgi:hypothetical protein